MYCRSAWCRTNKLDLLATWLQDHRVQERDLRPGRDLPGAGRKYFLASQSVLGFRLSRCVWSSRWHCMQGAGRCNSRKRSPSQSHGRCRFAYFFSGGAQDLAQKPKIRGKPQITQMTEAKEFGCDHRKEFVRNKKDTVSSFSNL